MIIESIKEFMKSCPYLENDRININCLGGKPVSYSIEQVADNPVIKKYCDGGVLKQYRFVFAMRDAYDENPVFNQAAAEFFEKLEEWIFKQNQIKNLPRLENEKHIAEGIEVVSDTQLFDSSIDSVRLQAEIRFIYRQEC